MSENEFRIPDLLLPRYVPLRVSPEGLGPWSGHLPFAYDLVRALRPRLVVELGTHWGESYFTFCQSVVENGVDSICYAVDHWHGEAHAGFYGEDVFGDVDGYNRQLYGSFSYLLRTSFEEAFHQFADDSIDLLHIDGLHTYEAVKHDFDKWFPKLRAGGVVLLHDIAARHEDFGVWRLWEELKSSHREWFEFHHSWGLGVLRKPGGELDSKYLKFLFAAHSTQDRAEYLRRYYVLYATHIKEQLASSCSGNGTLRRGPKKLPFAVYPHGVAGYSEASKLGVSFYQDQWDEIAIDLPSGWSSGPLRIDPLSQPGLVEIDFVRLRMQETGAIIWPIDAGWDALQYRNAAASFVSGAVLTLCAASDDLQVYLPQVVAPDAPIRLEVRLRAKTGPEFLVDAFSAWREAQEKEKESLQVELKTAQAERLALMTDLRQLAADKNSALLEVHSEELKRLRDALAREARFREEIVRSTSWKITAPARRLMEMLRLSR